MKTLKIALLILIVFLKGGLLIAQDKINDLKLASSPAAALIGGQPSAVLTPKSYQALETALYSNFVGDDGLVLPKDFAIEVTPYWISHHGLSSKDYLESNKLRLVANSSFSLATTQSFMLGDSTKTNALSIGYRNFIFFGNQNDRDKIKEYYEKRDKFGDQIVDLFQAITIIRDTKPAIKKDFITQLKPILETIMLKVYNQEEVDLILSKLQLKLDEYDDYDQNNLKPFQDYIEKSLAENDDYDIDLLVDEFHNYLKNRYGLAIDFAYAGLINFPTNDFEKSYSPRHALWLMPSYHLEGKWSFLKLIGVLRYQWYNMNYYNKYFSENKLFENNIDFGIAAEGSWDKLSLQIEVVGRNSSSRIPAGLSAEGDNLYYETKQTDIQYIGTLSYNLTDNIVLAYNIGKGFDPILNSDSNLISALALNFGFGAPKEKE